MAEYFSDVMARLAQLNQVLPRSTDLPPDQIRLRLGKMGFAPDLLGSYPEQVQAVCTGLEYVRKNNKQQGARLYVCFVVFEKVQQAIAQRRSVIQGDIQKAQQLLHEMQASSLFQAQSGPVEQRLTSNHNTLRMLEIFEEQVNKAQAFAQEHEATANQLILLSEQASVVIFKAMTIEMPTLAVDGMLRELDQVCTRSDTLKTQVDRLEAQVQQALAESSRLNLSLSL
ncbi:hypothetical protein [Anthocerotibacter panamensis]|uniref:hypothetical protein n=1 Tax=Anthocerotibacter panamensis TaxID=2857077 RepID=UPI001C406329|nr:hypothetical protein [Anthocerotibacter panamensis]